MRTIRSQYPSPTARHPVGRKQFRPTLETLEGRIAPAGDPLTTPPVIHSVNGVLTATLTEEIGPAVIGDTPVSDAWTYNGQYMGPTLMANPGDLLDITIVDDLTESTNLHTHGLHVSPLGDSDNSLLEIDPGQSNHYQIQLPTDHPQGLYWYHPHRHGLTNNQIIRGLSGLLVIGRPDGGRRSWTGWSRTCSASRTLRSRTAWLSTTPRTPTRSTRLTRSTARPTPS